MALGEVDRDNTALEANSTLACSCAPIPELAGLNDHIPGDLRFSLTETVAILARVFLCALYLIMP
jgi:hypothetical protein